ncbi:hypothetical protein TrRE_jg6910 [Triparma retinervis]|uniref:Cytochrome C biogenesis protein transmembrane domain-containing protein n=1 Tax=Triparma retinervis TaxID=2557542 RepID=A0A9W6ZKD7_9STRA|nr:hypothetical protein TrRE_jg6910 [Triparma retinervis]
MYNNLDRIGFTKKLRAQFEKNGTFTATNTVSGDKLLKLSDWMDVVMLLNGEIRLDDLQNAVKVNARNFVKARIDHLEYVTARDAVKNPDETANDRAKRLGRIKGETYERRSIRNEDTILKIIIGKCCEEQSGCTTIGIPVAHEHNGTAAMHLPDTGAYTLVSSIDNYPQYDMHTIQTCPICEGCNKGGSREGGERATLLYSLGLSLVFATLGVGLTAASATLDGGAVGGADVKGVLGGGVMIAMGGGVLDLWKVPLLGRSSSSLQSPTLPSSSPGYLWLLKPLFLGMTSGLVSSPCSTPVLTSLLAYLSSSTSLVAPVLSLCSYTFGYVTLLVLASFKGIESLEWAAGDEARNEGVMRVMGAGVVAVGGRMIMDAALGDASLRGAGLL